MEETTDMIIALLHCPVWYCQQYADPKVTQVNNCSTEDQ